MQREGYVTWPSFTVYTITKQYNLGMSIAAATAIGVTLVLILAGLLVLYLTRVEEKELAERFGEDYLVYMREVPFIIPKTPRGR